MATARAALKMIEVLMRSPRHPGRFVRITVPETFDRFREVDEFAQAVVEIMSGRQPTALPLNSSAFIAIKLAMLDTDDENEINMGIEMLRDIVQLRTQWIDGNITRLGYFHHSPFVSVS